MKTNKLITNKLLLNKQTTKTILLKFSIIIFLNFTDMILTYIGVTTGYCIEVNKLMLPIIDNLVTFPLVKVLLPVCLLTFIYFRMLDATFEQIKKSYKLLNALIVYYVVVNVINICGLLFMVMIV